MSAKAAAIGVVLLGLATSGCSLYHPGGPFAQAADDDVTGSMPTRLAKKEPTESDLAFARNAASDVLTKGDKDASQPWENAETGAHGSVTPLAEPYASEDGRTCRDVLASYVNGDTQRWLQGAACKVGNGRWEIHALKPWQRG
jgi:surface antigen